MIALTFGLTRSICLRCAPILHGQKVFSCVSNRPVISRTESKETMAESRKALPGLFRQPCRPSGRSSATVCGSVSYPVLRSLTSNGASSSRSQDKSIRVGAAQIYVRSANFIVSCLHHPQDGFRARTWQNTVSREDRFGSPNGFQIGRRIFSFEIRRNRLREISRGCPSIHCRVFTIARASRCAVGEFCCNQRSVVYSTAVG